MEFKSFYKTVSGNEGSKCYYPTRLDTYGCGCMHDCNYCYAKSLLSFRGLWNPKDPSVADINKIRKTIEKKIPKGSVVRLGGMTDCFQEKERTERVTYETIKELNKKGIHYLIVTKSDMVAEDDYINIMDKSLAHIQITVTVFDDKRYIELGYEKASLPSKRLMAIKKLQDAGFDVALRLSPLIPEFVDFDKLSKLKIDKIIVEFLRVNSWIEKWFGRFIDVNEYTLKSGGYRHLELNKKIELLNRIHGFKEVSVCEDESVAYQFWKKINPNPDDCCNLRGLHDEHIGRTDSESAEMEPD